MLKSTLELNRFANYCSICLRNRRFANFMHFFKDQFFSAPIWLVSQLRPHLNVCLFCFRQFNLFANLHLISFLLFLRWLYHICTSLRFSSKFERSSAERYRDSLLVSTICFFCLKNCENGFFNKSHCPADEKIFWFSIFKINTCINTYVSLFCLPHYLRKDYKIT